MNRTSISAVGVPLTPAGKFVMLIGTEISMVFVEQGHAKMITSSRKLPLWTLLLLFSLTLVSADFGCFTYFESALFCNDLNLEQAQQECSFYSDCNLAQNYLPTSCSENTDCEKILCKSTCREEFRNKCPSGELLPEERTAWCAAGCCQFKYVGGEYCQNKNSKWLCQVESQNKNSPNFIFDISKNGLPCEQRCGGSKVEEFLQGTIENESVLISPQINFDSKQKGSMGGFFLTLLLIILILVGIYFWKKRKLIPQKKKELSVVKPEIKPFLFPKVFRWFSPFKEVLPKKHFLKEKERQKFFLATGMTPLPTKSGPRETKHTEKLGRLAQRYSLPTSKPKFVEKPWKRLNAILEKPQKKEEKILPKIETPPTSNNLESLRKIAPSQSPENPAWERLRKMSTKK
jgi:hypothetical protein